MDVLNATDGAESDCYIQGELRLSAFRPDFSSHSFAEQFIDIWQKDLPVFISTFNNEPITMPADYRMWIGSGPYTLAVGDTVDAYFSIIAGENLNDLQANADDAVEKYELMLIS
jgi:hypothetical protein